MAMRTPLASVLDLAGIFIKAEKYIVHDTHAARFREEFGPKPKESPGGYLVFESGHSVFLMHFESGYLFCRPGFQ